MRFVFPLPCSCFAINYHEKKTPHRRHCPEAAHIFNVYRREIKFCGKVKHCSECAGNFSARPSTKIYFWRDRKARLRMRLLQPFWHAEDEIFKKSCVAWTQSDSRGAARRLLSRFHAEVFEIRSRNSQELKRRYRKSERRALVFRTAACNERNNAAHSFMRLKEFLGAARKPARAEYSN